MCTVSIIPLPLAGGYRLVTNRDEHRERAIALPPRWHEIGRSPGTRAIWPTDATAGGTWVATGEHGLTLGLLNLNQRGEGPAEFASRSRGLVIPGLIDSATPGEVAERLCGMELSGFLPFRLVAVGVADGGTMQVVECRWDGLAVGVVGHDGSPICFVSSGLGDRLAEPRLGLFEELVVARGATPEAQDEFHAHRWPARPQISVMMARADARTVSICRVSVVRGDGACQIQMDYEPVVEASEGCEAGLVRVLARAEPVRRAGGLSA